MRGKDKERVTSDSQKAVAHRSRYIVYPLLVVGIFLGVIAMALGMYSGIPLLASVGARKGGRNENVFDVFGVGFLKHCYSYQ